MPFIDYPDYKNHIRLQKLDALVAQEPAVRIDCEKRAIARVKDELRSRFDLDAIFRAQGDDRNETLLQCVVDITLYYLYQRLAPQRAVARKEIYLEALKLLERAKAGTVDLGLPLLRNQESSEPTAENSVRWGSKPKRDNYSTPENRETL